MHQPAVESQAADSEPLRALVDEYVDYHLAPSMWLWTVTYPDCFAPHVAFSLGRTNLLGNLCHCPRRRSVVLSGGRGIAPGGNPYRSLHSEDCSLWS